MCSSDLVRDVLDRRLPAAAPDVVGEALGVGRVVGQERQVLALHVAATPARHAPNLQLQKDIPDATGEIAYAPYPPVVPADVNNTADAADRFFERRTRVITRIRGLPNSP